MSIADDPRFRWNYKWFAQLTAQLWSRYLLPRFKDRPVAYLECGTCEAMSLVWSLENFGKHGGLFVGIDPFLNSRHWHEDEGERHKTAALANISAWYGIEPPTNPASDWGWQIDGLPTCELHREDSASYLLTEHRAFDVCYVDGAHNADQAILDIVLMFRLLRDGGVIVIDDYDRKVRGGRPQVKPAVDAFEVTFEGNFDVLYRHQKQVAFIKRPRRRRGFPPILEQGPIIEPSS
jgi:SAM-dependent methyltransferase